MSRHGPPLPFLRHHVTPDEKLPARTDLNEVAEETRAVARLLDNRGGVIQVRPTRLASGDDHLGEKLGRRDLDVIHARAFHGGVVRRRCGCRERFMDTARWLVALKQNHYETKGWPCGDRK